MSSPSAVTTVIRANDLEFTATVAGPESGDLVVLLHGFPQTRYAWRAEVEALAGAGFRACAPDQRGYSPGARPDGIAAYHIDHLVADVLAIADSLSADRFHLVGHDWGGQVAWTTAARHPARVRSLAVISRPHPAAFVASMRADGAQAGRSGHHRRFQRPEATDELLADDAAWLRAAYDRNGVPPDDAAAYLDVLCERDALDAAVNWYRAGRLSGVGAAETPAITRPTLYVWGDADATVGRQAAESTRSYVEGPYDFVELPGIGHFVTDQEPTAFPPLLLDHLDTHRNA